MAVVFEAALIPAHSYSIALRHVHSDLVVSLLPLRLVSLLSEIATELERRTWPAEVQVQAQMAQELRRCFLAQSALIAMNTPG